MSETTILSPEYILASPTAAPIANKALAIRGNRIAAIGGLDELRARWPDAGWELLPDCLVMAGLVNAHQHGRGISQVQLGYQDDFLELWISSRRGRGTLDPYPITKLAAANMLAHGVTTTVHANYTYGSGDYEAEVRASLRAYDETGIRVTMCVGAMDRGLTVYPPHEACFLAGLPTELQRWLSRPGKGPYAGGAKETIELMDRLLADYAGHPRITLCYGPAGPQWVSDELWRELSKDAERRGIGLHLHALESPAQAAVAAHLYPDGVFTHLERLGALHSRTTIAHGVWVSDRDLDAIARAGATVVRNPGCNLRLRNGIAPLTRYIARGVRVAIGTDNAALADDEDVLKELRLAALLARPADWHGDDPASSSELLAMATTHGAVAAQTAPDVGTIEPGRKADLIAVSLKRVRTPYLDSDMPLVDAFLARATGLDVQLTMVDGRVLYRDGELTNLDRAQVERMAATSALAARCPRNPDDLQRARELKERMTTLYREITRTPAPTTRD